MERDILSERRSLPAALVIVKDMMGPGEKPLPPVPLIEGKTVEALLWLLDNGVNHLVRAKAASELMKFIKLIRSPAQTTGLRRSAEMILAETDEARRNEKEEHTAAIADARALLAEIAEAKPRRLDKPRKVDQGGAGAAADSEGQMAHLVGARGAGLGKNALRRGRYRPLLFMECERTSRGDRADVRRRARRLR